MTTQYFILAILLRKVDAVFCPKKIFLQNAISCSSIAWSENFGGFVGSECECMHIHNLEVIHMDSICMLLQIPSCCACGLLSATITTFPVFSYCSSFLLSFYRVAKTCMFCNPTLFSTMIYLLLCRRVRAGSVDPLSACSIIKKQPKEKHTTISNLRRAALEHQKYVKGTTMYPLEHNPGHGLLCIVN